MYIVDARACNNVCPKTHARWLLWITFCTYGQRHAWFSVFFRHGELVFLLSVRCGCFQLYMDGIKAKRHVAAYASPFHASTCEA